MRLRFQRPKYDDDRNGWWQFNKKKIAERTKCVSWYKRCGLSRFYVKQIHKTNFALKDIASQNITSTIYMYYIYYSKHGGALATGCRILCFFNLRFLSRFSMRYIIFFFLLICMCIYVFKCVIVCFVVCTRNWKRGKKIVISGGSGWLWWWLVCEKRKWKQVYKVHEWREKYEISSTFCLFWLFGQWRNFFFFIRFAPRGNVYYAGLRDRFEYYESRIRGAGGWLVMVNVGKKCFFSFVNNLPSVALRRIMTYLHEPFTWSEDDGIATSNFESFFFY